MHSDRWWKLLFVDSEFQIFQKKEKIDYDILLNGIYPCGEKSFEKLELCKILSNYDSAWLVHR